MSWDAYLYRAENGKPAVTGQDEDGDDERWRHADWNYTHNTNGMIAAAYEAATGETTEQCGGSLGAVIGAAWWDRLNGASGEDGARYLGQIIAEMEANPARYYAMDPPNGWGSYNTLLPVLREMRDCPAKCGGESVWSVSG